MADNVILLEVVEKMGEILENDEDVLKEGNLAERLLSSIERISQDVRLLEGSMVLSTHSLVLAVTCVNKENFTGLTLTTSTMGDAELLDGESENDETNSLVLPRDLLTSSSNCANIERIAMAILPGAKLFEASKAQEADNETASRGEINSIVMSASAVGCPDLTLDSPATISLVHSSNVTLSIISYVGTAVSLLALIVTIVFFCCIQQAWADKSRESSAQFSHSVRSFSSALRRPIQSKPTKILINLCVALALSNLVFLVGMQDLLASLCWMLVEGFYMYLALVKVFMTNIPNFVWKSAIVGWGVPLVIVVITVSVNNTDNYKQLHSGICWLTGPAFYASFLAPVCFILLSNFMVFILVLRVLLGLTRHKIKKEDSSNTAKHLRRAVGVAILLGLTWVFGVLAVGKATVAFNFLFAIFNSLQGLFICLFYVILRPSTRSGTRSDTYRDSSASGTEQGSSARRQYSSSLEESHRRQVFLQNVKRIEEHNHKFFNSKTTYWMGINQFTDMTVEEYVSYNKLNYTDRSAPGFFSECKTFVSPSNFTAPGSVDWRSKGYVTPVLNQGRCGSCWAFSATGSLEGQHYRATGQLVPLSVQQLVDCTSQNYGCHGGNVDEAFTYIRKFGGVVSEEEYPYTGTDDQCHAVQSDVVATMSGCRDVSRGSEKALKLAVASQGPVSVGIDASASSFMQYEGGVYYEPSCVPYFLSHAVLVVGYGTKGEDQYWLVKNSWGPSWGVDGYILMARNKGNMCGIASRASFPVV
ncbi:hypothetical protein BaRGS_00017226 [Batillaria attramentaria]|uniref:G-protein coupled receptors family 2 profile 2 domain-containing protein n=1 Tax=Batillaria attramentaria TaxID=370345 RepID=A0ABD0KWW6_9CAEN